MSAEWVESVKFKNDETSYIVNESLSVPLDAGNRHYRDIQIWIAEGNVVAPEVTQDELEQNTTYLANLVEINTLNELDKSSIRDIREWVASQPSAPQALKDRESLAIAARGRLK